MFKKGIFGIFGKKDKPEMEPEVPEAAEAPVIAGHTVDMEPDYEAESVENPEDIISKLAEINSIIGDDDDDGDPMDDYFSGDAVAEEVAVEAEPEYAPPADVNTIYVPAGAILAVFPAELLNATVDEIISGYSNHEDFVFPFEKSEVMYGLSIGQVEIKIGELVNKLPFNIFQENVTLFYDQKVELPLMELLPHVPPAWFETRAQDCSQEEMVAEMEDLFPDLPASAMTEDEPVPVADEDHTPAMEATPVEEPVEIAPSPPLAATPEAAIMQTPMMPDEEPMEADEPVISSAFAPSTPVVQPPVAPPRAVPVAAPAPVPEPAPPPEPVAPAAPAPPPPVPVAPAAPVPPPPVPVAAPAVPVAAVAPSPVAPAELEQPKPRPAVALSAPRAAEPADDGNLVQEIRQAAHDVFAPDLSAQDRTIKDDEPAMSGLEDVIEWRSRAPNGIDVNRGGIDELCLLTGVGEHLAKVIINYREKHGRFNRLQDLLKITGLGSRTYQTMARLKPRADIRTAELQVNRMLSINSDTVSLNKVTQIALDSFRLDAMFISSIDGLVLAKGAKDDKALKLSDSLSAAAPQLYKRGHKALKQSQLPPADMFTFYIGKNSVTFAGSDQIFVVCIHGVDFPNQKQLKACRKLANELVWYCAYRAVIG